MPRHDPLPPARADHRSRLRRAIRWVLLFALAVAILADILVATAQDQFRPHMLIATGIGVFLTVALAGSLMLLVFHSAATGHDDSVANFDPEDHS